jgi:hypothetical protein
MHQLLLDAPSRQLTVTPEESLASSLTSHLHRCPVIPKLAEETMLFQHPSNVCASAPGLHVTSYGSQKQNMDVQIVCCIC